IMLPSETMIWQPEFTDKTLSRKIGAVQSELSGYIWEQLFYAPGRLFFWNISALMSFCRERD
ncbi:hypothetical protein ACI3QK_005232, partial [Escherichia coli]